MGVVETCAEVTKERKGTDGIVAGAGGISVEGCKTSGRVIIGGVAIERSVTIGSVTGAANVVRERVSASGAIEKPAGVAKERENASGSVKAAIDIAIQSSQTCRRILIAG